MMFDNELLLNDRIDMIKQVINKYGQDNFYVSYSGGKDSCVLSTLIDLAIPNNNIPRVYANTGIDYKMIYDFVKERAEIDNRIVILNPSVNIKQTLEKYGYPFKSKGHSVWVNRYQRKGKVKGVKAYLGELEGKKWSSQFSCPLALKYQFTSDFKLNISDKCCIKMKEEPLHNWAKINNKPYSFVGLRRDEGGRRSSAKCLVFKGNKLYNVQPLAVINNEFEEWFIKEYNVDICDIYKPPYNFTRTGCKGCPFSKNLERDLEIMEEFFPNERKQCEIIWEPIYKEYRRIGYRLKKESEED